MKNFLALGLTCLISVACLADNDNDFLANQSIQIASQPEASLTRVAGNLSAVFAKFQPQLDSSMKIVSPLEISGTQTQPVVKISIEKCILFICKRVDLDAEMSLTESSGPCDRNMILVAQLGRSSQFLTDVYDHFDVQICLNKVQSDLSLSAQAHHAPNYSPGTMQGEILKVLQLQITPITQALSSELNNN